MQGIREGKAREERNHTGHNAGKHSGPDRYHLLLLVVAFVAGNILSARSKTCGLFGLVCGGPLLALSLLFAALFCKFCGRR